MCTAAACIMSTGEYSRRGTSSHARMHARTHDELNKTASSLPITVQGRRHGRFGGRGV